MLTKYSPFEPLRTFDRFGKMMDQFMTPRSYDSHDWFPPVDIVDNAKEIKFVVDLPGIEEKDVSIELRNDILAVRGERKVEHEEKKDNYVVCERGWGSFERQFRLDHAVNTNKLSAKFENGVLYITAPKIETAEPKKIAITHK